MCPTSLMMSKHRLEKYRSRLRKPRVVWKSLKKKSRFSEPTAKWERDFTTNPGGHMFDQWRGHLSLACPCSIIAFSFIRYDMLSWAI